MNRATSKPAAATKRAQPKTHPNLKPKTRSPLKDLNAGVVFKSKSSNGSSSSSSTEPTACCSRFRSSNSGSNATYHHRSDCNSRNPRSATTTKPRMRSRKPSDQGRKIGDGITVSAADRVTKVNRLRQCQPINQKSVVSGGRIDLLPRSRRVEGAAGKSGNDFEFTPLGCKTGSLEFGSGNTLGSNNYERKDDGSGNTPPAEDTVSPEIQCGTMVMSISTPVCFGAGHVLSGVSDKRKCRPRGVLVVGGNCNGTDGLNILKGDLDGIGEIDSNHDLVPPLPVEASVHWLLSPCDEYDVQQNADSELLTSVHLQSSLPGSSGFITSSNVSTDKNGERFRNPLASPSKSFLFQCLESSSDKMASPSSQSPPCTTPNGEGVISWFDEMIHLNLAGPNSPFPKDTLDSENVVQIPESFSELPWLHSDDRIHGGEPNLDSAVDGLQGTSHSSESQIFVSEQFDSSFEFDSHSKPVSSAKFSQLQYHWDKSSWISDTIVENEQQSQFRISWRDGFSSHHIEMDNSNCCRILSDEEDKNVQYSTEPKLAEINTAPLIKKIDANNAGCVNSNENSILQQNIQCAESLSLDGGSLASSGDSGWDMCYKNNLFQILR